MPVTLLTTLLSRDHNSSPRALTEMPAVIAARASGRVMLAARTMPCWMLAHSGLARSLRIYDRILRLLIINSIREISMPV